MRPDVSPREGSPTTATFSAFTVVARNYLAHAIVLANSFARHHHGSRLKVFVLDEARPASPDGAEPFDRIVVEDLAISTREFQRMAGIYSVTELATAIKPWIFRLLLDATDRPVVFLDPDIEVFDSIDDAASLAGRHGIVLTPHTLVPMPRDGCMPGEREILQAGVYNLGFLALGGRVSAFLNWWQERLSWDCVIAPEQGLFVDQRWMDFVPGCFDHFVLRDPSWNVAYWNVHSRPVVWTGTRYEVEGRPLRFFHFSGFSPDRPDELSRHQAGRPRVRVSEEPALARLCADYAQQLKQCGHDSFSALPYGFDRMPNGVQLDQRMRTIYRRALLRAQCDDAAVPCPVDPAQSDAFVTWLRAPEEPGTDVSRYLRAVYDERQDLQHAFPGLAGPDGPRFLEWVRDSSDVVPPIPDAMLPKRRPQITLPEPRRRPAAWRRPAKNRRFEPGVNLVGYLRAENGVGEVARLFAGLLQEAGIPHAIVPWEETASRQLHPFAGGQDAASFDVNLICINADELPHFVHDVGASFLADRYNVGVWAWEVERFPEPMARNAELLDEIWGISCYTTRALAPFVNRPVRPFLLPVPRPLAGRLERSELGIPDGFLVLYSFDFDSVFERKNPLGVLEAFTRSFAPDEGAVLVLKSVNGDRHRAELERLRAAAAGRNDVRIIDAYLESARFLALIALCDVYVSLHRAEGFGLSLAQAMSLGKPVVATNFSANLEFMTPENACLVACRLVPVPDACDPYPTTARWAEPDIAEAARMLRRLYDEPAERREIGARARRDISRDLSLSARAEVLKRDWVDLRQRCTQKRLNAIRWFHRIEITPGVWTAGVQGDTQRTLSHIRMPEDLTGKTVLDVGAWDGFFSFEAKRRGAARVLATDSFCWGGGGWGTKEGFLLAREALRSNVEDLEIDCMDISPEAVGLWDIVLFMGVLYHLTNPLEAVARIAAVTRELLILETLVDTRSGEERPMLTFYPGAEMHDDPTTWFGPNVSAVEAMLRAAGFDRVEFLGVDAVDPHLEGNGNRRRSHNGWLQPALARIRGRALGPSVDSNDGPRRTDWEGVGRAAFHARK